MATDYYQNLFNNSPMGGGQYGSGPSNTYRNNPQAGVMGYIQSGQQWTPPPLVQQQIAASPQPQPMPQATTQPVGAPQVMPTKIQPQAPPPAAPVPTPQSQVPSGQGGFLQQLMSRFGGGGRPMSGTQAMGRPQMQRSPMRQLSAAPRQGQMQPRPAGNQAPMRPPMVGPTRTIVPPTSNPTMAPRQGQLRINPADYTR